MASANADDEIRRTTLGIPTVFLFNANLQHVRCAANDKPARVMGSHNAGKTDQRYESWTIEERQNIGGGSAIRFYRGDAGSGTAPAHQITNGEHENRTVRFRWRACCWAILNGLAVVCFPARQQFALRSRASIGFARASIFQGYRPKQTVGTYILGPETGVLQTHHISSSDAAPARV